MKSQFSLFVVAVTIVSSDAFHVQQGHGRISTLLSMSTPNTNTNAESTSSTSDNYVFPSIQAQQMEQRLQGESQFGIRRTVKDVIATFATHRELEAAGLIDESDKPEDVHRKAAEKFASFGKMVGTTVDATNNSGSTNELQIALLETAAALGRTTGQIFGGQEPENYRD